MKYLLVLFVFAFFVSAGCTDDEKIQPEDNEPGTVKIRNSDFKRYLHAAIKKLEPLNKDMPEPRPGVPGRLFLPGGPGRRT